MAQLQVYSRSARNVHLRIKEAVGGLDNANSLVVGGNGEYGIVGALQHSNKFQA